LTNCKANIASVEKDCEVVRDTITTIDVSISRIWNYDVERRRSAKAG
jgi:hypothetical protein